MHPPKRPDPQNLWATGQGGLFLDPAQFETKSAFAKFVTAITGSGRINCYACSVT
jgi:hypothetical protein